MVVVVVVVQEDTTTREQTRWGERRVCVCVCRVGLANLAAVAGATNDTKLRVAERRLHLRRKRKRTIVVG